MLPAIGIIMLVPVLVSFCCSSDSSVPITYMGIFLGVAAAKALAFVYSIDISISAAMYRHITTQIYACSCSSIILLLITLIQRLPVGNIRNFRKRRRRHCGCPLLTARSAHVVLLPIIMARYTISVASLLCALNFVLGTQ